MLRQLELDLETEPLSPLAPQDAFQPRARHARPSQANGPAPDDRGMLLQIPGEQEPMSAMGQRLEAGKFGSTDIHELDSLLGPGRKHRMAGLAPRAPGRLPEEEGEEKEEGTFGLLGGNTPPTSPNRFWGTSMQLAAPPKATLLLLL